MIKDQLGHIYGDDHIARAASRIKQPVLKNGVIARLGGDEFANLVVNIPEIKVKECIASIQQLGELYIVAQDYQNSMSVGYAYTTNSINYMEQLYTKADAAIVQMKNERKINAFIINGRLTFKHNLMVGRFFFLIAGKKGHHLTSYSM